MAEVLAGMTRSRSGDKEKRIVMIAGPNGAGKTTFAEEFLPKEANLPPFINADLIARGLSPFAPEAVAIQAGKIMLQQIAANVAAGRSFAFETTLSGMNYARHIPQWRAAGYHVKLIFLKLPSAKIAVSRVRHRVRQGGHQVPNAVVRRRFHSGLKNFHTVYKKLVDSWVLYDSAPAIPTRIDAEENA
jgi:predicted ABC-type ATPase